MEHSSNHIQTNDQGIGSHGIVLVFSEKFGPRLKFYFNEPNRYQNLLG